MEHNGSPPALQSFFNFVIALMSCFCSLFLFIVWHYLSFFVRCLSLCACDAVASIFFIISLPRCTSIYDIKVGVISFKEEESATQPLHHLMADLIVNSTVHPTCWHWPFIPLLITYLSLSYKYSDICGKEFKIRGLLKANKNTPSLS